jgi:hypothetical protein
VLKQKNHQKAMVGFRMNPDLREVLEVEAQERGITFSAYLETLIINRAHNSADVDKLKEKVFELEATVAEFRQQGAEKAETDNSSPLDTPDLSHQISEKGIENRMLKQQNAELVLKLNQVLKERDVIMKMQGKPIPHWMSDDGYNFFIQMLNELQKQYPNHTHQEVLLSAVGLAKFNESKPLFIIATLDKLWKHKPHFLTHIKSKGGQQ